MSLSGLNQQYIPNTLDGLNVVEADQIYIDGQLVNLSDYVPYQGANRTIDAGAQRIATTHTATASNDVVNKGLLDTTISNLSVAIGASFLDKITTTPQTVIGNVSYTAELSADNLRVPDTKVANLASVVDVGANYEQTTNDASVTTTQYFGSITSSMGIYQATSTQDMGKVQLGPALTVGQRYKVYINVLGSDTQDTVVTMYESNDGITPTASLQSEYFNANSTIFKVFERTFTATQPYVILVLFTAGGGATLKWFGLKRYETGVELEKVTLPLLGSSQIPIINDKKQLVGSGVSSTKVVYLDNVSSDIQVQLNSKLNLSGNNATQDIVLGGYKIQSTATPTVNADYTTKLYVDNEISGAGSLYVKKSGDSMTGTLSMGNNTVTTTRTPVSADDLTRKGYVDGQLALYLPLSGGTMTGDIIGSALNNLRWGRSGDKRNNLAPVDVAGGTMAWYFGTYTNDDFTPYADHLLLNGWVDTSGGLTNCISYNKGGKGIRQYQGTYGSSTKFTTYYDCVLTDANSADVTLTGAITANSVNVAGQTASRVCVFDGSKNVTSSSVTTTTLGYLDATSSIQTQLNTLSGNFVNYLPLGGGILSGTLALTSTNIIDFGYGVTKEANAGRIGYERFTSGCLDLVGGGTTSGDRRVVIYDKLGIGTNPISATFQVSGSGLFSGDLTVNGTTTSVNSRFLGSPDASPSGNFWIGLRGTGTEIQRLAIGINGNSTTGDVGFVTISKTLNLSGLTGSRVLTIDASNNVSSSSVTTTTLGYLDATSSIQGQLDSKASTTYVNTQLALKAGLADTQTFTGVNTFSNTMILSGYTASRVLQLDASKNIQTSNVTTTELGYVSGVTSSIQTQLNSKASTTYVDGQIATRVAKAGDLMTGSLRFSNNIVTEWGSGLTKEPNAGKIGYGWVSGTGLDIVGGGTVAGQRAVVCYDRLGVGIAPTVAFQVSGVGSISGNTGIGTTNPQSLLHLNSVGTHQVRFQTSHVDNHYITAANDLFSLNANLSLSGIPNVGRGSCQVILQTPTAGGFIQFMTGSAVNTVPSERMRLTGDGNLGIGSTTPRAKLDVSGDIITDWNGRRIGTQYLTNTSGYFLGMITDPSTRTLYLDSQSADSPATGAVVIRTGATPTERVRVDTYGQMASGVAGNTLYNLKFANSLSHIDNNAGEVYLFTAYQGHMAIGRNTNRDATTTNLVLGVAGTEEAQIISVKSDNSGYSPLSFASSRYVFTSGFVGIGTTNPTLPLHVYRASSGAVGRFEMGNTDSNYLTLNTNGTAGRMFIGMDSSTGTGLFGGGTAYMGWIGTPNNTAFGIATNNTERLRITSGGNVGIGTSNPTCKLDVRGVCEIYGTATSSTSTNSYGLQHTDGTITIGTFVGGAGTGGYIGTKTNHNFYIFTNDNVAQTTFKTNGYVGIGTTDPSSKFHLKDGWMRVDNGDISTCVYGPNTTWSARLRVGSGTSNYDATTAQIIATNGNLHLDPGYGKDFYIGFYNNNAGVLGTNYVYGDVQLRHKLTVGSGTSRTLMSVSGGDNGGAGRFGNIGDWPVNANGCLYTQDQPSGANSAGMFQGYNGANLAGYTTVLAPSVAWLTYFIYASDTQVFYNGALSAYTQAGGWVNVSDKREKEDIQDLKTNKSLQRVLALKPKHYRRKYSEDSATPVPQKCKEKRHVGFIAQEVQESNPHCVSTWCKEEAKCEEDDGVRLGMSYNDYVVHLVGAVQELHAKHELGLRKQDEQQKQIEEQKKRIDVLEEREKVWVEYSRQQEKAFADFKAQTDARIEKMAGLLTQLISKQ